MEPSASSPSAAAAAGPPTHHNNQESLDLGTLSDGDTQQQQQHLQSRINTQSNEVLPPQPAPHNTALLAAAISDPASNTSETARWAQDEMSEEDRSAPHSYGRRGIVIEPVMAPHMLVTRNLSVVQQRPMHSFPLSPQSSTSPSLSNLFEERTSVFAFGQNSYGELGI